MDFRNREAGEQRALVKNLGAVPQPFIGRQIAFFDVFEDLGH